VSIGIRDILMEMPARRSNYTLLSQVPDDQFAGAPTTSLYESLSGEGKSNNNKGKAERGFDWDAIGDHRGNRIGNPYSSSIGLQRQSSGSSFGESSLSGDYYAPTPLTAVATEIDSLGYMHDDVSFRVGGGGGELRAKAVGTTGGGSSSGKSWAQQTEESYQLQLALALSVDDPNFLDPNPEESASRSGFAEALSHRFWVWFIMNSVFLSYNLCFSQLSKKICFGLFWFLELLN